MSGRIDAGTKQRLKAAGQWQSFLMRRDELKADGYSPDDARAMALAEAMAGGGDDGLGGSLGGGAMPVAPAAIIPRTAPEPEIARWVARNIDNPTPDPANCPDPFAWTLLRLCRESPALAHLFVRDIWTKLLVAQARQGDGRGAAAELDGRPTLKLIERIREIRDQAQAHRAC